jgi:hypothetical protein
LLRTAASTISVKGLVLVFVDTVSRICNFAIPVANEKCPTMFELPVSLDRRAADINQQEEIIQNHMEGNSSDRFVEKVARHKLFDPFWRVECMYLSDGDSNDLRQVFKIGRPLWNAYIESGMKLSMVLELAVAKLSRGSYTKSASYASTNYRFHASMAICGIRFGMFTFTSSSLASDLVANYMAICVSISTQRNDLMICYPPEPILAEAAARLCLSMNDSGEMNFAHYVNVLDDLKTAMALGTVNAGDRGELIGRIVLLIAKDISSKKHNPAGLFSDPVPLKVFLDCLLRSTKDLPTLGHLENSLISFTHFGLCEYDPTAEKTLKDFYRNRTAIITKKNYAAVDLVIPLLLPASQVYGFIRIQVKNTEASMQSKVSAEFKASKEENCLGVYLQMNGMSMFIGADNNDSSKTDKDQSFSGTKTRNAKGNKKVSSSAEHSSSEKPCIVIDGLSDLNSLISGVYDFKSLLRENYSIRDWAAQYAPKDEFVNSVGKYIFDHAYHACSCGKSNKFRKGKSRAPSKGDCSRCKCVQLGVFCPKNCAKFCKNKDGFNRKKK